MNQIKEPMRLENEYLKQVYQLAVERDPNKPEFLQAVLELLLTLQPMVEKYPEMSRNAVLERMIEPERFIQFRVTWCDDQGAAHVNRGYRVQFNSALGPYKGGLRFHRSVTPSIIKFLGFEQIFKNSLTGLALGGGKGGSDFDPHGKSDDEVMRFCQSFMSELFRHIGPNTDVPAGDIGVGNREIGYLYGQYQRLRNVSEGALTGKDIFSGGSLARTEATGYGLCYFVEEMLGQMRHQSMRDQTVVVSGSGNVAIYAIQKAQQLGARVIAASDSDGYIVDEKGIDVEVLRQIKEVERGRIREYADRVPGSVYREDCSGIWSVPCQIALPCATQNEIDEKAASQLIQNRVEVVAEGANMPCTLDAIRLIRQEDILYVPSKAGNAGGVAVSGLEMSQNAARVNWNFEKVDRLLHSIMVSIFHNAYQASAEYNVEGDLLIGANIAGFTKVAKAMVWMGKV